MKTKLTILTIILFNINLKGQLNFNRIDNYNCINCDSHFKIEKERYEFSFEQAFDISLLNPTEDIAVWAIINHKNKIISSGSGNSIKDFVIKKPGQYKVVFSNLGKHQYSDTSNITILPYQIRYDIQNTSFSELPVVGVNSSNITIRIPIEVLTYQNKSYLLPKTTLELGVLKAFSDIQSIKSGQQVLQFKLSGTPIYAGPSQIVINESVVYTFNILPTKN
jgi:hypothetical protein